MQYVVVKSCECGDQGALMSRDTSISARGAPCNGQELAQQQVGLFHAHVAQGCMTHNVSGVEIQHVAVFAKRYCDSGVYDFAIVAYHGQKHMLIAPETCVWHWSWIAVYLNPTWSLVQSTCARNMQPPMLSTLI